MSGRKGILSRSGDQGDSCGFFSFFFSSESMVRVFETCVKASRKIQQTFSIGGK
jgi:hypothetical protein